MCWDAGVALLPWQETLDNTARVFVQETPRLYDWGRMFTLLARVVAGTFCNGTA